MEKGAFAFRSSQVKDIFWAGKRDRAFRSAKMLIELSSYTCCRSVGVADLSAPTVPTTRSSSKWNLKDLVETVVPHFLRYPLLSSKRADFVLFNEICQRMNRGEHRTREGFRTIVEAAMRMNSSVKRKYSSGDILESLATR